MCPVMVRWLGILIGTLRSTVRTHRELALENLALRQQLAVWKARQPRPPLTALDRIFWVVVSKLWKSWRNSLHVVQPATVVGWHRRGFRRLSLLKSRPARLICILRTDQLSSRSWSDGSESSSGQEEAVFERTARRWRTWRCGSNSPCGRREPRPRLTRM